MGVVGMNSLSWCNGECLNENKGCNACLVAVEIMQYRQCICSFLISLEEIIKKAPQRIFSQITPCKVTACGLYDCKLCHSLPNAHSAL